MISFFHVSKVYEKGNRALHEVNVSIGKGEFVFLTGPSGAGKPPFLKLIFRDDFILIFFSIFDLKLLLFIVFSVNLKLSVAANFIKTVYNNAVEEPPPFCCYE